MLAVPITLFAGGIGGFVWYMNDGTWNGVIAKVRFACPCMCACVLRLVVGCMHPLSKFGRALLLRPSCARGIEKARVACSRAHLDLVRFILVPGCHCMVCSVLRCGSYPFPFPFPRQSSTAYPSGPRVVHGGSGQRGVLVLPHRPHPVSPAHHPVRVHHHVAGPHPWCVTLHPRTRCTRHAAIRGLTWACFVLSGLGLCAHFFGGSQGREGWCRWSVCRRAGPGIDARTFHLPRAVGVHRCSFPSNLSFRWQCTVRWSLATARRRSAPPSLLRARCTSCVRCHPPAPASFPCAKKLKYPLLALHVFPPIRWSHSISFTRAQGIPKYKIGFGRGKGWESWGKIG